MTKKLWKRFPEWYFVADDQFKRAPVINETTVFYWTGHSPHKLIRNIYSKLPDNACILYVSATNLPLPKWRVHIKFQSDVEPLYEAVHGKNLREKAGALILSAASSEIAKTGLRRRNRHWPPPSTRSKTPIT